MNAIELISLDTVSVGCLLLGGLFLYDIFWVFGTDVMVTVAKGLEVPIKCKRREKGGGGGRERGERGGGRGRERERSLISSLSLLQWCFQWTCWKKVYWPRTLAC